MLDRGYTSHFVAKTYGRGLMPLDYAGLKKQRYRWAFGGMQILRIHARRLFGVGNRGALTAAQRASYVNGGLQWLNDPLTFAFSALLLAGGAALLLGGSLFVQPVVGPVLLIPPLFIVLAVMRFAWALRVRTGCGWGEALDALTVLMGMTWVVTLACVRGLVSREGTFLRTPKTGDSPRLRDAVRVVSWETGVGLTCVALAAALVLSGPAVTFSARGLAVLLLVWQAVVYLSALRTSLWSYREGRGDARQLALLRSAGRSVGRFLSEPRLAIPLALGCALLGALYILSARQAPTVERIYRANPTGELLDVPSVLPPTVTEQAGAVLVQESEAARRQDVDAALALWASDGVLVDRNFTPGTAADDRRWTGLDEVRLRYEEEFRLRDYTSLRHLNITVRDLGDSLVVANDVDARIRDETGVRRVRLVQSDRWVLRRVGGAWRVVRLEINRAPAS